MFYIVFTIVWIEIVFVYKFFFGQLLNEYPATPTSVGPSMFATVPATSKPVVTTAPSNLPPNNLPPLKHKTAIVKQKVPPPVPPRGSPRAKRSNQHGSGQTLNSTPKSISSTGSVTARQFDSLMVDSNSSITDDRIRDWLERIENIHEKPSAKKIEIVEKPTVPMKPSIPAVVVKTQCLQREDSFKTLSQRSPLSSVRSIVRTLSRRSIERPIVRSKPVRPRPPAPIRQTNEISNVGSQHSSVHPSNSALINDLKRHFEKQNDIYKRPIPIRRKSRKKKSAPIPVATPGAKLYLEIPKNCDENFNQI